MAKLRDKTLLDNNRRLLSFNRAEVGNVLPEYFVKENAKLIQFLEAYYDWMDSADNPGGIINRLYSNRDATQVPEKLLPFLEDELLLGQSYFGGFLNKREAIKFSNQMYRSKGTKYSIEQFFRGFFGIDPTIEYTKERVFKIGPRINYDLDSVNNTGQQIEEAGSQIGPESRKFITNDKLYQTYAILIRSGLPVSEWIDVYKLFVHPAGVYVGAETLLEAYNENQIDVVQDDIGLPLPVYLKSTAIADAAIEAYSQITLLADGDGTIAVHRQRLDQTFGEVGSRTLAQVDQGYDDLVEMLSKNSLTMDDSSMDFSADSDNGIALRPNFGMHRYSTVFDSANMADSTNWVP